MLFAGNALLFERILEPNHINFNAGRFVCFGVEVLYSTEDIKQVMPDYLALVILFPGYTDTHRLTIGLIHDDIELLVLYEIQITEEG